LIIDLHSHTNFSDGALSPPQLVQRAVSNGVSHLAITDHDCTGGLEVALLATESAQLQIIPGVEISCLWQQREVHVIGLFIDTAEPHLQALLQGQQLLRMERAQEFADRLQAIGISGLMDYIQSLPCQAVSRNHIADFLIKEGRATDKQQAFKKFLGNNGRVRTAAHWCSIATAVAGIRAANGIAVLAHADRYRLTRMKLILLIEEFKDAGGEGIEVSYSNLSHEQLLSMAKLCEEMELWASVGSDFHTPDAGWMDLGRIRQLPQNCRERAIWLHPRWAGSESDPVARYIT
jgi:3',5'-nucleoside bisphosphate phosphatase